MKAGDDPSEISLDPLRISAATTLAAGGEVSQKVIQREGRWKSSESSKLYTRNTEDVSIVSRKLAETGKIGQRQPGQGTVWGRTPQYRRHLGVGGCQWFATIWGLGRQRLRVLVPRPVGWGGSSRILAARWETRSSGRCRGYHASGAPSQRRRE